MGLRLLLLVCVSAFFCSCHPDDKKAASIDPRPNDVSFSREDAETLDKSASIRTFVLSDSSEFFTIEMIYFLYTEKQRGIDFLWGAYCGLETILRKVWIPR